MRELNSLMYGRPPLYQASFTVARRENTDMCLVIDCGTTVHAEQLQPNDHILRALKL